MRILQKLVLFLFALLLVITPLNAYSLPKKDVLTLEQWRPEKGDRLALDIDNSLGYLVHTDNKRISFPIITGQNRYISYIGLSYYGATPKQKWVAKRMDIQGDRYTFGLEGKFFRLFKDDKPTHYGLHTHAAQDVMFAREDKYQSYGCPILQPEILDIVEETFELNGGELNVWSI
jgi:hypothetical protein